VVVAQGRSVAQGTVQELLEQAGETKFEDAFVKLAFPLQYPAESQESV
jgi:sodium transport system ATP-binding protein